MQRTISFVGLVLLASCIACRKEAPQRVCGDLSASAPLNAYLEVTDDPKAIEAARMLARHLQPAPLSIASLNDVYNVSLHMIPFGMSHEEAKHQLLPIVKNDELSGEKRCAAACLIALMDADEGQTLIIELLSSVDVGAQKAVLKTLRSAFAIPRNRLNPVLADLLRSLVRHPTLARDAATTCAVLGIPQFIELFEEVVDNAPLGARSDLLLWLAERKPNERVFRQLVELLGELEVRNREPCVYSLCILLRNCDASLRLRVSDVIATELLAQIKVSPDAIHDVNQSNCMAALDHGIGPKVAELAEIVIAKSKDTALHRSVYTFQRRKEGASARVRLLRDLSDDRLRATALQAIKKIYKGSHDSVLATGLTNYCRDVESIEIRGDIAEVLEDIGGEQAEKALRAICSTLPEADSARFLSWIDRLPPEQIVSVLDDIGVIKAPDPRAFLQKLLDRRPMRDNSIRDVKDYSLESILSDVGLLVVVVGEAADDSARNDNLIEELARASGGCLIPTACTQQTHEAHGSTSETHHIVQFIMNDNLYRFTVRNFGDWYDQARVIKACNRALEDGGSGRQFHAIAGYDPHGVYVCITPDQARVMKERFQVVWTEVYGAKIQETVEWEERIEKRR